MKTLLRQFHKDEQAQSLVEYGLILILVALGAVAGMSTLAKSINAAFAQIASSLT